MTGLAMATMALIDYITQRRREGGVSRAGAVWLAAGVQRGFSRMTLY